MIRTLRLCEGSLYTGDVIPLVILLDQFWSVDVFFRLPGVIAHGISLPFDEILQLLAMSEVSMVHDAFYFELFFSIDKVRWGTREVWSVHGVLAIGGK